MHFPCDAFARHSSIVIISVDASQIRCGRGFRIFKTFLHTSSLLSDPHGNLAKLGEETEVQGH